jgi:dienelactone hydrolase
VSEVLLFHHAQGLTSGCGALADRLRAPGRVVHLPDLYEGQTFSEIDDGVAYGEEVGSPWRSELPAQIHLMERDEIAAEDLDAARVLADEMPSAELLLYPGDAHLFTDRSLPAYDQAAATLVEERVLRFLADLG